MLYEMLIASICSSTPGLYTFACSKATEATMYKLEIVQTENQVKDAMLNQAHILVGDQPWKIGNILGSIGGIGLKVHRDHELTYRITTKRFLPIDFITPTIKGLGPNLTASGGLGVGWGF